MLRECLLTLASTFREITPYFAHGKMDHISWMDSMKRRPNVSKLAHQTAAKSLRATFGDATISSPEMTSMLTTAIIEKEKSFPF
jgi:hypothetical protein